MLRLLCKALANSVGNTAHKQRALIAHSSGSGYNAFRSQQQHARDAQCWARRRSLAFDAAVSAAVLAAMISFAMPSCFRSLKASDSLFDRSFSAASKKEAHVRI